MQKDFDSWNTAKKELHDKKGRPFFHEREIWWSSLGNNIGFEQDGKGLDFSRPVLVFKKFNNEICWVIPITTQVKKGKFYVEIMLGDNKLRAAILSQIKLMDAKRFQEKLGSISCEDFNNIKTAMVHLIEASRS